MRRVRVLIHLAVFFVLAEPILTAATATDQIFRSDSGRACFRDILRENAWGLGGPYERAAFLVDNGSGSITCVGWESKHVYLKETYTGAMPRGTLAIAHTHPFNQPWPSQQDRREASRLGIPIYVISLHGIYRANPGKMGFTIVVQDRKWIEETPRPSLSFAAGG